MNNVFIRLDADNIGDAIELSLINNDINNANRIHHEVQSGIKFLEKQIKENRGCVILMKGCDDILFKIMYKYYSETFLVELKEEFLRLTGHSVSIGVAYKMEEALLNLRKAKLTGKNNIVSSVIEQHGTENI